MSDKSKRALVVLNGEIEPSLAHVDATDYDLIVAVDGAIHVLLENDWRPAIVLGDFDSADEQVLQQARDLGIEVLHTPDQEYTDFEKTLQHLESLDVTDVDVIGHTGRRLDHSLGAIDVATRYSDAMMIRMVDPLGTGYIVPMDEVFVIKDQAGKTCSVLALVPANVTLAGFKWPLSGARLGGGARQSVSNVIDSDEAIVHVDEGVVLVYLNY